MSDLLFLFEMLKTYSTNEASTFVTKQSGIGGIDLAHSSPKKSARYGFASAKLFELDMAS